MSEKLLPCPHCGNEPKHEELFNAHRLMCSGKGCRSLVFGDTLEDVIALWNRRAPAPLKKWTKEMGTPPDGLYYTGFQLGDRVVEIDTQSQPGFVVLTRRKNSKCRGCASPLWFVYNTLYGPIEAEGGETNG